MHAPPFGATAALKFDMNCICTAVGRPSSVFSSRANMHAACTRTRSATPARTPSDFMMAASIGRRLPPFGVCHQEAREPHGFEGAGIRRVEGNPRDVGGA